MSIFVALSNLAGASGRELAFEAEKRGYITQSEFDWVLKNIMYNSEESVNMYMGIVCWFYNKRPK